MEIDDAPEKVESQEPAAEDLTAELEAARAEAEKHKQEAEKHKQDYANFQKTYQKALEEGRISRSLDDKFTDMINRFDELEMNQAILVDRLQTLGQDNFNLQEATPQERESAVEKTRKAREERMAKQREQEEEARDVDRFSKMLEVSGIPKDDPEVIEKLLSLPTPREAIDKFPAFVKERNERNRADAEKAQKEKEEMAAAEKEKEEAGKNGELLQPESPPGQNGILDDNAFLEAYAKGEVDDHKRAQKILKGD